MAIAFSMLSTMVGTGIYRGDAAAGTPGAIERPRDYVLMLDSRQFAPEEGVQPGLRAEIGLLGEIEPGERRHIIIQFLDIPDESGVALLKSRGITLLDYLPNFAYFASVPARELGWLEAFPGLRALVALDPDDKVSTYLRKQGVSPHARSEDGTVRLVVTLFGDVSAEEARATLKKYGPIGPPGEMIDEAYDEDYTLELSVPEDLIYDLAGEDVVQWIAQVPPAKQELLDEARATVNADSVQAPPYNLDGSGTALGIWDSGSPAITHDDFAGRLTIADGAPTGTHATTVAGIMAGDGSRSEACGGTPYQWRGISTAADIIAYGWPGTLAELRTETSEAIGTYGVISSSNSWGWYVCGSWCSYYGTYDSWSKVYDNIVRGSRGAPISVVFGAANEQDCFECEDSLLHFPYGTIPGPGATSKNTIAVGATYTIDKAMTTFSSWGPVKDGRVKPDIVAPGCKATSGIMGPYPPNAYDDSLCGTSFATPMISGSLGILRHEFDLLGYGLVMPHTFKAILIETAEDLGNPGPDYMFGHGHLELKDAVDLVIADHPHNELIRVDSVAHGEIDTYHMDVGSGVGQLRVTLVWDDYKGTPGAAKALVNDLDLLVQSPGGSWYYAYNLNPTDPSAPATTGYNDVDNVEVVEVSGPETGRWTIKVEGAVVPEAPQDYTLVLPFDDPSGGLGEEQRFPPEFNLSANIPNPFRKITLIRFDLPQPAAVTLRIYDARGRSIKTLVDESLKPAGRHTVYWDGVSDAGRSVAAGVYFYRIEAGNYAETRRMILLR
jgi:hypothetical protein